MPPRSDLPSAEIIVRDQDFRLHIAALGLKTAEEYVQWCAERGLSTRLKKHWQERGRERFTAAQEPLARRRKLARAQVRNPRQTLESLFAGELSEADLTQPPLQFIHRLLPAIEDAKTRDAFEQLLLHVQGQSGLIGVTSAWPGLGEQAGNTYIEGLLALAGASGHWLRELKDWQPPSHNVRRQFSSLAAHLTGKYPVPLFMDSAWFRGRSEIGLQQQGWYLALASGESPRKLNLPIPLTKKMARCFLQAPPDLLIESVLRWGQVVGLGGRAPLAKAILGSRLGASFANNDFWTTVIRSLADHPMLDAHQVGPIIDFIYHQKFEPQLGEVGPEQVELQPLNPDFSMQGRTPMSLLAQMRDWHAGLRRKGTPKPDLAWLSSGISPLELAEGEIAEDSRRIWSITELCTRSELFEEGRVMRHCVASYDSSCEFGRSSIWSLGVDLGNGRRKRVLTIEVSNRRKVICQVRGQANRLPTQKELELIRRWAAQEQLGIDSHIAP